MHKAQSMSTSETSQVYDSVLDFWYKHKHSSFSLLLNLQTEKVTQ